MHDSKKRVVILDFDGTLADSIPIVRDIYNDLARKNGWKTVNDKNYQKLRQGRLRDAIKWSGMPFWKFPIILKGARRLMKAEAEKVEIFPGFAELVEDLSRKNVEIYILSRNLSSTIHEVLKRHSLDSKIIILDPHKILFWSKSAVIKKLINNSKYDKKYIWMIGDEVRDIQSAKKAGINSIAVTWGAQAETILKSYKPNYIARTVEELKQILNSVT